MSTFHSISTVQYKLLYFPQPLFVHLYLIKKFHIIFWQDACLDKLDRFIRGDMSSLRVDSPHSRMGRGSRGDSGRSTPTSLLLPLPSSPTLLNRFLKHRAVSIDSDLGSQST